MEVLRGQPVGRNPGPPLWKGAGRPLRVTSPAGTPWSRLVQMELGGAPPLATASGKAPPIRPLRGGAPPTRPSFLPLAAARHLE